MVRNPKDYTTILITKVLRKKLINLKLTNLDSYHEIITRMVEQLEVINKKKKMEKNND